MTADVLKLYSSHPNFSQVFHLILRMPARLCLIAVCIYNDSYQKRKKVSESHVCTRTIEYSRNQAYVFAPLSLALLPTVDFTITFLV
jgi:hypothetical protein